MIKIQRMKTWAAWIILWCFIITQTAKGDAAADVITRFAGDKAPFSLAPLPGSGEHEFITTVKNGTLIIQANSPVAHCRGFYHATKYNKRGICSWSGNRFEAGLWPNGQQLRGGSPFEYRYYLNVVSFGYTTVFWDWTRWEKEIDRMALHGINMPLALTAQEAIMARVYHRLGLHADEIARSFSGPAHLPWLRMGNISGIDAPLPSSWHDKQVALQHKILSRMRELGMHPICPGFSGVVSAEWVKKFPSEPVLKLHWGEQKRFETYLLQAHSPMFQRMQKMFIEEWEREFGSNEYYLIDSFNEMPVPEDLDLATYGEAVYKSLESAHPGAIWVMQGWMFGYQRDIWTQKRLQELLSRVPDHQMLLLDLAADYTHLIWKQAPNNEFYKGFFGKRWVLSYIPNMGGKTAYTGNLHFYATHPAQAMTAPPELRPQGFGFAPEGLENNEVIYELLSDAAWSHTEIDLIPWLHHYSTCRYGLCPPCIHHYWKELLHGPYGSFTDHPRYAWQGRSGRIRTTVCTKGLLPALQHLANAYPQLQGNPLYLADLRELGAIWLGGISPTPPFELIDALLDAHPLHRLEPWLQKARSFGTTKEEADYYERSARRIITTWGPGVEDYAARLWSGLIRDYYAPRYRLEQSGATPAQLSHMENQWVEHTKGTSPAPDSRTALHQLLHLINQPFHHTRKIN